MSRISVRPRLCCAIPFSSRFTRAAASLLLGLGLTAGASYAATYDLSVSNSSNRSSAVALQGASISGSVYVFTSNAGNLQNSTPSGISSVCFWLDNTAMSGTATHCEAAVPYDYAGSASTSAGSPWNTGAVANGTHTITQKVTLSAGGTEVDTASFTVQNNAQGSVVYALSVSASATHGGAVALQGASLTGNMYVFTSLASGLTNSLPTGISNVCYWLDNTSMSGTATHCEAAAPYDYAGSASTSAGNPWNTTLASNGTHTITQLVTKSAGGTEVDTSTFSVQNGSQSGSVYALSVSANSNRSGGIALQGATLSGSAYIFTSLASQLTNFSPSGVASACFWLDNVFMSGTANNCEYASPYDYATSASTSAGNPWNTGAVANGTHTITQSVTKSAGGTEVNTSTFTVQNATSGTAHYLYLLWAQTLYVFDLDNGFQQVKQISLPQVQGGRGLAAAISSHMLYISYGGAGGSEGTGSLLKYDLLTDTVVWTKAYNFGVDSFSLTHNGTTIYMPDGEATNNGIWYVLDAATGNVLGSINTGMLGPHSTIVSLDDSQVYMAPGSSSYLPVDSTATNTVIRNIGPMLSGQQTGVRPFTINGKHTLAFTTAHYFLGFQVSDTTTGNVLYTVPIPGFTFNGISSIPSHGITLAPDETELYVIDNSNSYVHVFDIRGLPSSAPTKVASIPLVGDFLGYNSPCSTHCNREGWLLHSRDGHYVFVGDNGGVIDTRTRQLLQNVPSAFSLSLNNTRTYIEIDWQNGVPVFTTTRYGLGYIQ